MAILCTTCGTELDLPPGPPPRQVRCPVCRAIMDTDLARRIDPDPHSTPESAVYDRRPASSALPVVLILFVVGSAVTVCTGLLFLFLVAVVANEQAAQPAVAVPAPAPPRPVVIRPMADVNPPAFNMPNAGNPIPAPPPFVVVPGPPVVVPPLPPRALVPPRPPQYQPPRPVVPPPPRPAAPRR